MNDDYYKQLQELYHSVKLEMTNLGYFNELAHHGIKGQKWGVRRFQNQDGTLTDAGKKRYSNGSSSSNGSTLLSPSQKHNFEYNRRRKLSAKESDAELEDLTKWYNSDFEDPIYQDEVAMKKSLDLQREIIKFSGDWYNSKGVSPGFKECIRESNKHHSSNDRLLGVVLTDLGYKDTPKARELIYYLVITD